MAKKKRKKKKPKVFTSVSQILETYLPPVPPPPKGPRL